MSPKAGSTLRGEAAWKAAREDIARKNAATWERARKDRASRNAAVVAKRVEEDRKERASARRMHPG
jgi:hypothetical protein